MPMTEAATAAHLLFKPLQMDWAEIPAERASRKVVVTVENMIIRRPAMPMPARTQISAISDVPA